MALFKYFKRKDELHDPHGALSHSMEKVWFNNCHDLDYTKIKTTNSLISTYHESLTPRKKPAIRYIFKKCWHDQGGHCVCTLANTNYCTLFCVLQCMLYSLYMNIVYVYIVSGLCLKKTDIRLIKELVQFSLKITKRTCYNATQYSV